MTALLSYVKQQAAASAFMRLRNITKKMILFVNLNGKGLTQEINEIDAPSDGSRFFFTSTTFLITPIT